MTERLPLVVINGQVQELPSGDTTPSSGQGSSSNLTGLVYFERPKSTPNLNSFPTNIYDNTPGGDISVSSDSEKITYTWNENNGLFFYHQGKSKNGGGALEVGEEVIWYQSTNMPSVNYRLYGIGFRAATGNPIIFGHNVSNNSFMINVREMNRTTYGYVSHYYQNGTHFNSSGQWFRYRQIGPTTGTFSVSYDGQFWIVIYTHNNFAPIEWGPFMYAESSTTTGNASVSFYSFEDPDNALSYFTIPYATSGDEGKFLALDQNRKYHYVDIHHTTSIIEDISGNRVCTNEDLVGNVIIEMNNSSTQTYTVEAGLTGTEPVTIIQKGSGSLSIVAGTSVTINSLNQNKTLSGQYGYVTLIPNGTNSYYLIGSLISP